MLKLLAQCNFNQVPQGLKPGAQDSNHFQASNWSNSNLYSNWTNQMFENDPSLKHKSCKSQAIKFFTLHFLVLEHFHDLRFQDDFVSDKIMDQSWSSIKGKS